MVGYCENMLTPKLVHHLAKAAIGTNMNLNKLKTANTLMAQNGNGRRLTERNCYGRKTVVCFAQLSKEVA